jgi:transcriptional regulator with XRE-family HTH domain
MSEIRIGELAARVRARRSGKGIREAASEVGVSPATLSRVENGGIPDLETFGRVCRWLGEDPAIYLGMPAATASPMQTARVHFKKGVTVKRDSARALGELILATQQALLAETFDE